MWTIYICRGISPSPEPNVFFQEVIQRHLTRTNNGAKKFYLTRTKGRWRLFLWQRWLPERKGRSSSEDDEKWKEVHELGLNLVWWCFPWWYWWWCCQCKTFKERMTGTIPQRHLQSRTDAKYILLSGEEKIMFVIILILELNQTKKHQKVTFTKGLFTYYVSQKQGFVGPPPPPRQLLSAIGLPPLPPSSAFVSICRPPPPLSRLT